MKRSILLLCLGLSAQAQPLPLAWPQRPEGLILSLTQTFDYPGSSAATGDGAMLIAWADALDGDGRVVLQKFSGGQPSEPGHWRSQVPGQGEVEGLFLPRGEGSATLPWVVSDGADGGIAVWQEIHEERSSLRACRINDGPDGLGGLAWPQPTTISDDVLLNVDDCRDARDERCRSVEYDPAKAACEDGAGGVWTLWRTPGLALRLQHVDAGGALDADFPAAGLELSPLAIAFSLAADGQGRAVVAWREYVEAGLSALLVQAVGPDGGLTLPAGPLALGMADGSLATFQLQTVGAGRVAAVWTQYVGAGLDNIQAQLLDEHLAPQFTGELTVGVATSGYGIQTACESPAGPLYVAWDDVSPKAQLVSLDGATHWGDGVPLGVVGSGTEVHPRVMAASGGHLYCLLVDYSDSVGGAFLMAFTDHGVPAWSEAQARLLAYPDTWWRGSLEADGGGGVLLACESAAPTGYSLQIRHRTTEAEDLITPAAGLRRHSAGGYALDAVVLPQEDRALVLWNDWNEIRVQSVDATSGNPLLAESGVVLELPPQDFLPATLPDGDGGIWLVCQGTRNQNQVSPALLTRLSQDGGMLLPLQPVTPGADQAEGFMGQQSPRLALGNQRLYVAIEEFSPTPEIRLQALDLQGQPLWSDEGVLAASGEYVDLGTLTPDGNGGVLLTWTLFEGFQIVGTYLLGFDADGQSTIGGNNGRGLLLSNLVYSSADLVRVLPGLDRGTLVAWSEMYHVEGGQLEPSLYLALVDESGALSWSQRISSHWWVGLDVGLTPEGLASVACTEFSALGPRLVQRHYNGDGDLVAQWSGGAEQLHEPVRVCQLTGPGAPGLVVTNYMYGSPGECGLAGLSPAPGDTLQADFCGQPVTHPVHCHMQDLATDATGGAWYLWRDGRCEDASYGYQLRLLRLSQTDDAVDPRSAAAPASITLAPNIPNPFNPETWITFGLSQAGPARLEIFNLAGQRVRVLADGLRPAGTHRLHFDGRDEAGNPLASGLYFHRLSALSQVRTGRMLLVR